MSVVEVFSIPACSRLAEELLAAERTADQSGQSVIVGILAGVVIVRDQLALNLLKEAFLDDRWPLSGDESVAFGFGQLRLALAPISFIDFAFSDVRGVSQKIINRPGTPEIAAAFFAGFRDVALGSIAVGVQEFDELCDAAEFQELLEDEFHIGLLFLIHEKMAAFVRIDVITEDANAAGSETALGTGLRPFLNTGDDGFPFKLRETDGLHDHQFAHGC